MHCRKILIFLMFLTVNINAQQSIDSLWSFSWIPSIQEEPVLLNLRHIDSASVFSYSDKPIGILRLPEQTRKSIQYEYVAPVIMLMNLYRHHVAETKVHIGWRFIINEHRDSNNDVQYSIARSIYYPKAIQYLEPYEYDHSYNDGNIIYGLDERLHIEEYKSYLEQQHDLQHYIRVEKILVRKKPSFEDFLEWTQHYFEKESKELQFRFYDDPVDEIEKGKDYLRFDELKIKEN